MYYRALNFVLLLSLFCLLVTGIVTYSLGIIGVETFQVWVRGGGVWAPIIYIVLYVIATILVLPSTALNLAGGAIFGPWMGTLWTSIGAILAAIVAFVFTRTIGRRMVARHLGKRWQALEAELQLGGIFYMFAVRLIPVMPYGLVNFAAGLTSISFRNYLIGTTLGTVPSVAPFVFLGSSGSQALHSGDVLPLLLSLALTGVLVAGSTWYRRRRSLSSSIQNYLSSHSSVDVGSKDV